MKVDFGDFQFLRIEPKVVRFVSGVATALLGSGGLLTLPFLLVSFAVNAILQGSFTHVWINEFGAEGKGGLTFHINKLNLFNFLKTKGCNRRLLFELLVILVKLKAVCWNNT